MHTRTADTNYDKARDQIWSHKCASHTDDQLGTEEERRALQLVVVDEASRGVNFVGHRLEEHARRRDLLRRGREAMSEVTAVGQVEAHEAAVRPENARVHGHIRGRPGQCLHVNAPAVGAQVERGKCAIDAELLDAVDVLVAAVISSADRSFAVLVGGRAA